MKNQDTRIKVIYIISQIDKAVGFEWIAENLDPTKFALSFILLNDGPTYLAKYFTQNNIPFHTIYYTGRKDVPAVLWQMLKILRKEKPDVIHTHMIGADMVGLAAGKLLGIKKRIYTRHTSNYNKKYHNKQGLDKLINFLSTHILAISKNVRDILIKEENVSASKIRLAYHGFDLERFQNVSPAEKSSLQEKYNPLHRKPVIGVVARYMQWKGIQYTIEAFKQILQNYPNAFLLLANAKRGDFKDELEALLSGLPAESYCEVEFEHDLFALYQLFDIYVHVPIDEEIEAFGQTYVEALAAGIPSVFTNSGIAREFIEDGKNALVVDFQSSEQIYENIKKLLENKELRENLSETGKADVCKLFSLKQMIEKYEALYSE